MEEIRLRRERLGKKWQDEVWEEKFEGEQEI